MNHHAYYIEGSMAQYDAYQSLLHPLHARLYERFGIDEARELVSLASLKNFTDTVFLIATASITSEAQQALLKLFEEPQAGTTFVVLVPYGVLLPTLRSRMLRYPKKLELLGHKPPSIFLKASSKERSAYIAELLKDEENQKERVREFLHELEIALSTQIKNKQVRAALEDIARMRSYLNDRSPSLKMLLEHVAMSVPAV